MFPQIVSTISKLSSTRNGRVSAYHLAGLTVIGNRDERGIWETG